MYSFVFTTRNNSQW